MNEQDDLEISIANRLDRRAAAIAVGASTMSSVRSRARQRQRRRVGSVSAAAAIATGSIIAVRVASSDSGRSVAPADSGVAPVATTAPPTEPASTESLPTEPASTPAFTRTLRLGDHNDDVATLQRRLHAMSFDPGPIDGTFGEATQQAVWAFQGMYLGRTYAQQTDVVDGVVWSSMMSSAASSPRRPGAGTHVEIHLDLQVLAVFTNDVPTLVAHISSGSGQQWCEAITYDTDDKGQPIDPPIQKDVCGVSKTPGGVFQFYRRYSGNRLGPLGGMFNPVYFNYGIAVHGAHVVPKEPVSHGTIRIPESIAEYFPSLVHDGDRVYVFDGVKEPEEVRGRDTLPVFNYPNPNPSSATTAPHP